MGAEVTRRGYGQTLLAKRTLDLAESLLEAPEEVLLGIAHELRGEDEPTKKLAACMLECAARVHGEKTGG
jgi:hypothetical protein